MTKEEILQKLQFDTRLRGLSMPFPRYDGKKN